MTGFRNMLQGAAGVSTGGYPVDNSVMTDDASAMGLTKTYGSAGGSNKTFTISCWFKIANLSLSNARTLWCFDVSGSGQTLMELESDDTLRILMEDTSNVIQLDWNTTQVFRDPHAWYHAVWTVDTTPATPISKLFINGSEVTSFTKTTDSLAQNDTFNIGSTANVRAAVGIRTSLSVQRFTGYISEMVYLDGSVVSDATSFGEYDTNGVWRPIDVSGLTFGTNGFYLDFAASGDLGNDVSGNANDFTTSGSPTQSSDTPTKNFCVLTPLEYGGSGGVATYSEGNLKVVQSNGSALNTFGSIGLSSGKWHYEVTLTNTVDQFGLGIIPVGNVTGNTNQFFNLGIGAMVSGSNDGKVYNNGSNVATITSGSGSDGQTFSCEIDLDNDQLEWFNNAGSSLGTYSFTPTTANGGRYLPCVHCNDNATYVVNFGASTFSKTPSTGFTGISAALLNAASAPAVADVSDGYVETTDTEANIVSALATLRSAHTDYIEIYKNLDAVEEWVVKFSDDTGNFMSFNDNDAKATFPTLAGSNVWLGASLRVGSTYGVYTTTVSHTNGSDTDSAHGLTSSTGRYACIVKRESTGGGDWYLDHPALTSGYNIVFGSASAAVEQNSTVYADVDATNGTVLSAAPTGTYRVIVFAEVTGFLELPDWNGNGISDGPLVNLTLAPTFGIFKTYKTTTGDWIVHSTAVDDNTAAGNPRNTRLILNGTQSDSTDYAVDYGANFFKTRDSQNAINASVPMLGILIGQASFGSSPATAR